MKKKNSINIPSKYIFSGLLIVCVILIFLSYATGFSGGPVGIIANYTIVPLERGVSYVAETIKFGSRDARSQQELVEENEKLLKEIDELNSEISNQRIKLKELDRLYSLLSIKDEYSNYPTVGARIIASGSTNYYNTFVIDKGSANGLTKDMNVLTNGGLVGIITDVGKNYAVVRTIIDDSSNVSACFSSTGDNCIVSGSVNDYKNNNLLAFENLDDPDGNVKSGDIVITSNISDKYLPGLMIGYAVDINPDSNNLTVSGTIVPAVDFKRMNEVLVILKTKETYIPDGD